MGDWIDRDGELKPADGQRVFVKVKCQNPANDFVDTARYDARCDLFTPDGYAQKVVAWMPTPEKRATEVDWEQWRASYEERKGR